MRKIVYILPGHKESHRTHKSYTKVASLFEKNGFEVVHVDIQWDASFPKQFAVFTKQFLLQFKKVRGAKVYVLGFSYGATIAFLTAKRTYPAHLILCSLSPYFSEDLKNLEPIWLKFWKRDFTKSDYSFKVFAPGVVSRVDLIAGSEEHSSVLKRARDARKRLSNASLTIAKGAKHNIGQKEYLATIEKLIDRLD